MIRLSLDHLISLLLCAISLTLPATATAHDNHETVQYGNPWTIKDPASIPPRASGKLPQEPEKLRPWSAECTGASQQGAYPNATGYAPPGYGTGVHPSSSMYPQSPPAYPPAYPATGYQQPGYGYYSPYYSDGYGYPSGIPAFNQPFGPGLPGTGTGMLPGPGSLFGYPGFW